MGYNTALILLNDRLSDVRDCPDIGTRIYRGVLRANREDGDINPGMTALPSMHADVAQVVVIAANSIRPLGFGHWRDDDVELLRAVADQHGFRLVRKTVRAA
jgi:hypothetical protein